MEKQKNIQIKVLDDGFVRLIDYMGDDAAIVQAARISYGDGTKHVSDDRKLIRYLMRHKHSSPFEMVELKFHVRVPMDTWRQWIRHRTANVNEYSTRYSEAINATQKTKTNSWRKQSKTNKQCSSGNISNEIGIFLSGQEEELHKLSQKVYKHRLETGVAREQARKDLPLSTYTEAYWKIDLHNLLHFLKLRLASGAQQEIREYAQALSKIVESLFPITWEAFCNYELDAIILNKQEQEILELLIYDKKEKVEELLIKYNFMRIELIDASKFEQKIIKNSEFIEFINKLKRMNLDLLLTRIL